MAYSEERSELNSWKNELILEFSYTENANRIKYSRKVDAIKKAIANLEEAYEKYWEKENRERMMLNKMGGCGYRPLISKECYEIPRPQKPQRQE